VGEIVEDAERLDRETEAIDAGIGTVVDPPSCEALTTAEQICGGDPRGMWQVREGCLVADAYDPLDGTCDAFRADATGEVAGTVEIGIESGFRLELVDQRVQAESAFDLACYGGSTSPCDGAVFGGSCQLAGEQCECETSQALATTIEEGGWQRWDGALVVLSAETITQYDFCRMGPDVLTLTRPAVDNGVAWTLVLERIGEVP
jgi:hypothetical protein